MITGTVTSLEPKDWNGTTLWSFKVDGGRVYYRTGRTDPANVGITVGNRYSFSVDGKNNVDVASIAQQEGAAVSTATTVQSVAQGGDNRQERIEAQSARRDAISIVSMLLQQGVLKFPPKIPEADKPTFVAGLVKEFADHFNPYESTNLLETEEDAQDALYD